MPTRVKICGLSTEVTLAAALDAGADMIGLVLFPKSPRHVDIARAADLAGQARGRAVTVALTVDADDALLDRIVAEVKPGMLQLHGRETPERVAAVRARLGVPVMKAIAVATAGDAAFARLYRDAADLVLFDAKAPAGAARPGGNGAAFDWRVLDAVKDAAPYALSGGLTPANVAAAIRTTGAAIVDVSSGVESAPGVKDTDLIRAFMTAARAL